MATAKPKRMMLGGVAKGAMNSVKKAVAAKAAPMKMQNAARSAAQQAAPKQMQFMSDKLRGGKSVGLGGAMPKPAMGLGAAMANKNLGKAGASVGRALGAGKVMKKGGVIKKATKK